MHHTLSKSAYLLISAFLCISIQDISAQDHHRLVTITPDESRIVHENQPTVQIIGHDADDSFWVVDPSEEQKQKTKLKRDINKQRLVPAKQPE